MTTLMLYRDPRTNGPDADESGERPTLPRLAPDAPRSDAALVIDLTDEALSDDDEDA